MQNKARRLQIVFEKKIKKILFSAPRSILPSLRVRQGDIREDACDSGENCTPRVSIFRNAYCQEQPSP